MNFQPLGGRILVRRLRLCSHVSLLDLSPTIETGAILSEGIVLAVGPGEYDEDGEFSSTTIEPGQKIIFNARWNDFTSGELVGSDCDKKGPLERPIPQWQWDKRDLHLITEGDIAGILA